jgi:hypothetical protein
MKCLSKNAADRLPSAKALALALAHEMPPLRAQPPSSRADLVAVTGSGSHPVVAPQKKPAPPQAVVALVLIKTGQQIRLSKPVTTIGRSADCEITVRASDVSKHHCRLELKPGGVVVEDLDSANGTSVNGEAVRRAALKHGDVLKVADHAFEVRVLKSGG